MYENNLNKDPRIIKINNNIYTVLIKSSID